MRVPWYLMAKGKGRGGYKTASGPIVSVNDALAAPLRSLLVNIDPVQDLHGYDAPWPAGGGKNKYPVLVGADTASGFNGGSATNDNGTLVVDVNTTLYSGCYLNANSEAYKLALKMSGQCTVSYYAKADKILDVYIGYQPRGNSKKSLTTSWQRFIDTAIFDETGYTFNVYNANTGGSPVAGTVYIKDFMFETGGTASDYAPYSNICPISGWTEAKVWVKPTYDPTADPTATIQLGQTVYGGTLDVTNGVLTVEYAILSKKWSEGTDSGTATDIRRKAFYPPVNADISIRNKFKCNYAKVVGSYGVIGLLIVADNQFYLTLPTDTDGDTNIQILYPLATPITIPLTATQIATLAGQNVLWADAGDVTVEYLASGGANSDLMKLAVAFMGRK